MMGVNPMSSSSISAFSSGSYIKPAPSNPDPKRFAIHLAREYHGHLILDITYKDVVNYEGRKILVFDKGVTIEQLAAQDGIDPHFSDTSDLIHPIARFDPRRGWYMAYAFARAWREVCDA